MLTSFRDAKTQDDFSPILAHVSKKNAKVLNLSDSLHKTSHKNSLNKLEKGSNDSLVGSEGKGTSSGTESPRLSQFGDLSNHSEFDEAAVRLSVALSEYDNVEKSTESLIADILPENEAKICKSKSEDEMTKSKANKNPPDRGKDEEDVEIPLVPNSNVIQNEVPEENEVSCGIASARMDKHIRNDSIRRSIFKTRMHKRMSDDDGMVLFSNGSVTKGRGNHKDHEIMKFCHNVRQKRHPESHV